MNDETDEELETEDEDLFEEFDVILASLTRRLIKCDLEDFELVSAWLSYVFVNFTIFHYRTNLLIIRAIQAWA